MIQAVTIYITGRVQGVGFRHYTQLAAKEYQIMGFVSNQPDGSVYIEAEGREEMLRLFLEFCKRGPAWARVDKIEIKESVVKNYKNFISK